LERQARCASRAVSRELQERAAHARLSRVVAGGVQGLPRGRRVETSQLERPGRRDNRAAERGGRGVGADRRAEISIFNPPEPAPQRAHILLPPPAWSEREAVVEA